MQHISNWKEEDLFKYLQAKIPDLKKMEDKYSRWDCVSDDRKYVVELKCRKTHYPTLLIEKKKYDALVDKALILNYQPIYINSTPLGIFGWNILKEHIDWKIEHKHPSSTQFHNRNTVPKEVGYLSIDSSHKVLKVLNNG